MKLCRNLLLIVFLIGFCSGCVTRTTRKAGSTWDSGAKGSKNDGKMVERKIIWIWDEEYKKGEKRK